MGVVYEAFDRERQMAVALKTLRKVDPAAIYRFKNEFRALADVSHRNLVSLYELVVDGQDWFFTMELLRGKHFVRYVRADTTTQMEDEPPTMTIAPGDATSPTRQSKPQIAVSAPANVDYDELRTLTAQLAEGVCVLHASGHLHRDIKPSNVMVTEEDRRVVLLDFGVITGLANASEQVGGLVEIVGTPAYMAPELGTATPITEATDWYSVGVMLYEALTGQRPIAGDRETLMSRKRARAPASPQSIDANVPDDLNDLCVDLLAIDPGSRPSGIEVLQRLKGNTRATTRPELESQAERDDYSLIGRERHLVELRSAFAMTQRGVGVTVYVRGRSGMGKTMLVNHFLDDLVGRGRAVVLAGRCYERETVPYKTVDSLVDSLSRYLTELPRQETERFMPRDAPMLARVFPVLRRVDAIAQARRRTIASPDPHELRRRGFAALRELLVRVAEERPLVLFIDDIQWGDVDSLPLLSELMRPPDAPPLLLVVAYRAEEENSSPLLRALFRRESRLGPASSARRLPVDALNVHEAQALAEVLLRGSNAEPGAAETIARESGGSPLFVNELARFFRSSVPTTNMPGITLSLDQVIRNRVGLLVSSAQRLVEVVAVAGRPIQLSIAQDAASMSHADRTALIPQLKAARLIRVSGVGDADVIECFHDRVREVLVANLSGDERRGRHTALAQALMRRSNPDPQRLAMHLFEAGDVERAAEYATAAADEAAEALAFDRAAELYRMAAAIAPLDDAERRALRAKLGDALENAGACVDAAEQFMAAAKGADAADGIEYRRRAALDYLRAGQVDEGNSCLQEVLSAVGYDLPDTPRGVLVGLALRRARLRLRGLGFKERSEEELPPALLRRLDVCWTAAVGLGMSETFRGADFQTRHLLLALAAGEPYRVARALTIETIYRSLAGRRGQHSARKVMGMALELAERVHRPELYAWVWGGAALLEYQMGRFSAAKRLSERAVMMFRDKCSNVLWELNNAELYRLWCQFYLGDLRDMSQRLQELLVEAHHRGDRYTESILRIGVPAVAWLMADRADDALREAEAVIESWSERGYHLQHYWAMLARCQALLYRGSAKQAFDSVNANRVGMKGAMLFRIQTVRVETRFLRARAALAMAETDADYISHAERDAKKIWREKMPWSEPIAYLLLAGVSALRGNHAEARRGLIMAEEGFMANDMAMFSVLCRYRRAQLAGSHLARDIVEEALSWLRHQGVAEPRRFAAMFTPGFDTQNG